MVSRPRVPFRVYLITDRHAVKSGDLIATCEAVLAAAPAGTVALQVREKDLSGRELYELAFKLRAICKRYGAPMLINDRIDVAMAVEADGVHLPSNSIGPAHARKLLGPERLIGVSTHSQEEITAAASEGADFAVFGPVFDPISKGAYRPALGLDALEAACGTASIPVFALGGITPARARELLDAGAAGVAAIGAILGADSPADAMRAMLAALSSPNAS
ncbi:MAG TPA: thiamine phosphate synthase [Candidatus Binataceae bacterium]|nr:thiamine phosphate synthase [Candidatus Binataceae bacterium]